MLAGLLFATHDADDSPGTLAATLPFGGVTLIEYQARLLIQAGAAQIVVVVSRLTPELLGAIARIGKRGVTVDAVRSAAEASAKVHPLARILAIADGLVTTDVVIAPLSREGADTLLVVDEAGAASSFERVGGQSAWAGVARLSPQRLAEVGALPQDYDVQSALIRVAAQAQAHHLLLADQELRQGHGIEHRADALETRGRAILAAVVSGRRAWFERWIVAPIARVAMPWLTRRGTATLAITIGAGAAAAVGLITIAFGYGGPGLLLLLAATIAASIGATLAWLRDEFVIARALTIGLAVVPALAVLLYGRSIDRLFGYTTAGLLSLTIVVAAALAERAASEHLRRRWWGTPGGYLTILTLFAVPGLPGAGLAIVALYAVATLAHAIEMLRRQA